MTLKQYINRPLTPSEAKRAAMALVVVKEAAVILDRRTKTEVTLLNRINPNGIVVSMRPGQEAKVERFINLAWAKRHGYAS